jgi:uncharacterized protein with FMN-binding domain
MRRITLWIVSTVAAVVLLFGYRTSLGGTVPSAAGAAAPGVVPDSPGPAGTANAPAPSASARPPGSAKTVRVNGTVAQTRWGPVQVQVTIAGGRITDVRALLRPIGNDRDEEINTYAVPQLRAEVLGAQSANIDTVSGATVTSGGYIESLQAALDAAHFG